MYTWENQTRAKNSLLGGALVVDYRARAMLFGRVVGVPPVAAVWLVCCVWLPAIASDTVDYQRDIQPIVSEHCFKCHGPDEGARQADLRLDRGDASMAELVPGKSAIVPGKLEQSELVRRISSNDLEMVMPPPSEKNGLNAEQIATITQWIQEGASYSRHWAFVAPERVELPQTVEVDKADRHPTDAFVAAGLAGNGLNFSPPARPEMLCRRIYLDLIGLPPSPQEVERFVAAARRDLPSAVGAKVEQLLASPHFGEKWARHWLDVARYSDSNGYEKDMPREQWAWRDWVIRAINSSMPYDQFLIEQIAGDLLPGPTQDQVIATGFLRNGMTNEEGAIVSEQFRMEGMFDRMDCLGKAILGVSLQCAQCHSHKFDPISQDEYYGMFAFLNDTHEAQASVFTKDQLARIEQIKQAIERINDGVKSARPDWRTELARWEAKQKASAVDWEILETFDETWIGGLNHPETLDDHSITNLGHPTRTGELYVRSQPDLQGLTGLRLEVLTYADLPNNGPGRSLLGTFALTELTAQIKRPDRDTWQDLPLAEPTADFSTEERPMASVPNAEVKEDDKQRVGPVAFMIDGDDTTAWYADRGPGRRNTDSVAVVQFTEPLDFASGTQLRVDLHFRNSLREDLKTGDFGRGLLTIGRFRLAVTKSQNPHATRYGHAATLAMQKPAVDRTTDEQQAVFSAWRKSVSDLAGVEAEIDELFNHYPDTAPTSVLSLSARSPELHRKTFVLNRGVWDRPLHQVDPHVPAALHPLSSGASLDRLTFARWLVDRRSPLTARVQVNRVWQAIFGRGLLETSEDFGTRAPRPEYLDLLDYLAVDFMDRGWSLKNLVRTITTSKTYQQSSWATPEAHRQDPQNRWLARGPRFRAEAEIVRDIALASAGLLNRNIGGPSIFPPVPENVLKSNFHILDYWKVATGSDRYRRSLYVFRKRTMPDPVLSTFDAPNSNTACARRPRSSTPLAALVSLNEPLFVETARALALRILREGGPTDERRADYAYRLCTGRPVKPVEWKAIGSLLTGQRQRLADGWLSISELATGAADQRPQLPPGTTPQDAAVWFLVARVMLNLDETLSKN